MEMCVIILPIIAQQHYCACAIALRTYRKWFPYSRRARSTANRILDVKPVEIPRYALGQLKWLRVSDSAEQWVAGFSSRGNYNWLLRNDFRKTPRVPGARAVGRSDSTSSAKSRQRERERSKVFVSSSTANVSSFCRIIIVHDFYYALPMYIRTCMHLYSTNA